MSCTTDLATNVMISAKLVTWYNDHQLTANIKNPYNFCSMDILLDWITEEDNFKAWVGKYGPKVPKSQLLDECLKVYLDYGITHHTTDAIKSNIDRMFTQYKAAEAWRMLPEQHIKAEDIGKDDFHDRREAIEGTPKP